VVLFQRWHLVEKVNQWRRQDVAPDNPRYGFNVLFQFSVQQDEEWFNCVHREPALFELSAGKTTGKYCKARREKTLSVFRDDAINEPPESHFTSSHRVNLKEKIFSLDSIFRCQVERNKA